MKDDVKRSSDPAPSQASVLPDEPQESEAPSEVGSGAANRTSAAPAAGAGIGGAIPSSHSMGSAGRSAGARSAVGEISGLRKAAVFVLSLDEDDASLVLRDLNDEELGRITAEIAELGFVEKDTVATVLREFGELEQLHTLVQEGGLEQAVRIVERSFPKERAQRILELLAAQRQSLPFAFLERVEVETLLAILEEEHPQTLAVILVHMSPGKAGDLLGRLPSDLRKDVLERIAALDGANTEALEQVELTLGKHLNHVRYESLGEAGGIRAAAHILRAAALDGTALLEDIRQDQPELAEEIGKHLFVFGDIVRVDDRLLEAALRDVDMKLLAMALKDAGDAVKLKCLNSLNRRRAEELRFETERLGPVRRSDVMAAQEAVLETVLCLQGEAQVAAGPSRAAQEKRRFF